MPSSSELWRNFLALTAPAIGAEGRFSAKLIPGRINDYLAKGVNGEPLVLLHVSESYFARPPLKLRHVSVEYAQECKVQEEDQQPVVGHFVMVSCSPDNPTLFELFVRSADTLINTIPVKPTIGQIEGCVRGFVELYRKLSQANPKTIKGLWAELFLIATSSSPKEFLAAWHVDATEKFDFSRDATHLEVKASELGQRIHEFALGQVRPLEGTRVFVASILLRRSAGGAGILDLADRIATEIAGNHNLISKLWGNIAQSMGEEFGDATDIKFDELYAKDSLRIIPSYAIPCVQTPLAPEILDVHIKVDVTSAANEYSVPRERVEDLIVIP